MFTASDKALISVVIVFGLLTAAKYFNVPVDDTLKNALIAIATGGAVWGTPNKGA